MPTPDTDTRSPSDDLPPLVEKYPDFDNLARAASYRAARRANKRVDHVLTTLCALALIAVITIEILRLVR